MFFKRQIQIGIKAQVKAIIKAKVKILLFDKTFIIILVEYSNYDNIFLVKNLVKLLEYTKINDYTIKLEKNKQLFFRLIYSLKLVKLKILKTYIKINLANSFIQLFQFYISKFILFDQKPDKNLCFCINY